MRLAVAIGWAAALAGAGWAQEDRLPPEVLLLQRIKLHMREEIARQPDYTCLETAERYQRDAGAKGPAALRDTVVLEVLTSGDKEFFGSPGARDFPADTPLAFTGGGLGATGTFALHARSIFLNDVAMFQYRGEETVLGRRAVRYDYRVPEMLSGYTIVVAAGRAKVAMQGSFWADPTTLDVIRLSVDAADIPPALALVSATQTIDYARVRIGNRDALLPQSGVIEMAHESGEVNRNLMAFTHCRSYAAESQIRWDSPSPPPDLPAAQAERETPILPPGLRVTIELTTPVTERDAVGKQIEGRVVEPVMQKRKVIVPAGAAVRGRIRRMERHADSGGYFVVGLEFTEVEVGDAPARFYAILQDVAEGGPIRLMLERGVRPGKGEIFRTEQMHLAYLPGVASFFVTGDRVDVPAGFRTVWKTKSER